MDITVQVRQRGTLTLPADLRQKYGIESGDTFRLIDLDGVLVLTPMTPMVPELAREIERLRVESGLSIEELLTALREERARYSEEKYGERAPS
jgi:bifunctional DNA-binding transcriptional regulator/antitoxin component of YhaV-PrlF toxin-antitoxin module